MVCLETSFLIDFLRGNQKATFFMKNLSQQNQIVNIPAPVIMEIISGAELQETKKEKQQIVEFISSQRVLPLDQESSILSGEIQAQLIMRGEIIEEMDIMIAAIAIKNNETLITKNKKHFERIKNLKIETY